MLIVIICLVLIALALLFAPVRICARVHVRGLSAWASVSVETFFGLYRPRAAAAFIFGVKKPFRTAVPYPISRIKIKKEPHKVVIKKTAAFSPRLSKSILANILDVLEFEELKLRLEIGVPNDAAMTALLSGIGFSVFSPLFAILRTRFLRARLHLQCLPYYENARFDVAANCIIRVDLAHIIVASIKAILHYYKGALRQWHIPSRA